LRPCRSSKEAEPLEKFLVIGFRTYEERNSLSVRTMSSARTAYVRSDRESGRTSRAD
jgi:hypothetical protein